MGSTPQGALPPEDNLVLGPQEEEEVKTKEYDGNRYPTLASPNLLPHPPMHAPSGLSKNQFRVAMLAGHPVGEGNPQINQVESVPATPTRGSPFSAWRDSTPKESSSSRGESISNSPPLQVLTTDEQGSPELNGSFNGGCIWKEQYGPDWVRIRAILDSGASMSIAPPSMAKWGARRRVGNVQQGTRLYCGKSRTNREQGTAGSKRHDRRRQAG